MKPARLAVPPGVVTLTSPEAPLPTFAVIVVKETTVKDEAATPPKLTVFAPSKFVPVIVTIAPEMPLVGVQEVTVGG